jgi:hypothetical protein
MPSRVPRGWHCVARAIDSAHRSIVKEPRRQLVINNLIYDRNFNVRDFLLKQLKK